MAVLATTAMTLGELLGSVPAEVSGVQVTDLVTDSRQVRPGAAFLAIQGERGHGLEYLEEAVRKGASVVLFEPSYEAKMELAPGIGAEPSLSLAVPDLSSRLGQLAQKFDGLIERGPRLIGVTGTTERVRWPIWSLRLRLYAGIPAHTWGPWELVSHLNLSLKN